MPTTDTPLAELAVTYPAASRVFHDHRLDYCCGGDRTLAAACAEAGLDARRVLAAVLAADAGDDTPTATLAAQDLDGLVAHIVTRYHEPLRGELARLTEMARKVERVHADKPGCPRGLASHLAAWGDEVLDHLEKEEQVLFPSFPTPDPSVVTALMREHDDHADALRTTRELTGDLVPPAHACTTWRALYLGLVDLERELMEHVHLENHVLFPRALAR